MKPTHEVVLLYNLGNEKGKKLKMLFVQMGVRIKNIPKEMYSQKIGFLVGIKTFEKTQEYKGEGFLDEMLVLKGFTEKRLDLLLLQMKKNDIKVNLKAVITEQNQNWDSLELYQELKKEHTIMQEK